MARKPTPTSKARNGGNPAADRDDVKNQPNLAAFGVGGARWSGRQRLAGDFRTELSGRRRQRVYTRMLKTSPELFACERVFRMLAGKPTYTNVPAIEGDTESEWLAEKFNEILDDMTVPLQDAASSSISSYSRGFWIAEVIFKMRRGPDAPMEQLQSKYNDGFFGIEALEPRSQDSIDTWDMDSRQRNVIGFSQEVVGIAGRPYVPMGKCLHLTPFCDNGSPEGDGGALEPAYYPWWKVTNLGEVESIGLERDANGLPVFRVPPDILFSSKPEDQLIVRAIETMGAKLRMDETASLLWPGKKDKNGQDTPWDFELATSDRSSASASLDVAQKREYTRMLLVYVCTFLSLGQQSNGGSYSLSADLTDLVSNVIGSLLGQFVKQVQHKLWPKIARLNGWNAAKIPTLKHSDIERQDAAKFATALGQLVTSGVFPASPNVARFAAGELGWEGLDTDADAAMLVPAGDPSAQAAQAGADVPVEAAMPEWDPSSMRNFMTMNQVKASLGYGAGGVMGLVRRGELRAFRFGRSYRFDPKDVHALRSGAAVDPETLTPKPGPGHVPPVNGSGTPVDDA